ncbi:S-layer homology domain-containing protein [Paenibacillus sedimenti]|uniref:S-layer homology domain-containing protein n=1 Tax=Paenibacillus sedimenti TaxID=2770274 RepID=A0A926QM44_9BACL|nr:S-layer homology domain-containing protein [Paenibacillus sedimenti]MBD0383262.1 S-layer homology domain-containing protein [Paenibacillus sedimenti]
MLFNAVRRKLSTILVFALLLSTFMPLSAFGAAAQFQDIADSYAQKEIQTLVESGIISGYEDHSFQPKKAMTRAELAKIIVLSLGLKESADKAAPFKDVDANSWYRGFVGALVESGITQGTSAATFSPDSKVTREELVVFFIRAFGLEDTAKKLPVDAKLSDVSDVSEWAKAHVSLAFKMGFVNGVEGANGTLKFNPKDQAERQALARLAYEFKANTSKYVEKANELAAAVDKGTKPEEKPAAGGGTPSRSQNQDEQNHDSGDDDDDQGNPGGSPSTPLTGSIQALVNGQSVDTIFAAEPTEVTFRASLNTNVATGLKLYKVDNNNNVIAELTSLYDDGQESHGDSLKADGIYSGTVSLTESAEGYIRVQALSGGVSSNVLKLSVVNHLTDQQFTQVSSMSNDTQAKYSQLISELGDTQQAKEETVAWLEAQPEVESAGISGSGGSIWYVMDSGILGGISAAPQNSKGLSAADGQVESSGDALQTVTPMLQSLEQASTSVGSKRAAVISPFYSKLASATVYDAVYNIIDQSEYPFEAERIKDAVADVNFFKGLKNYGVVVLDTHGDTFYNETVLQTLYVKYGIEFQTVGPQVMFLTGEMATSENKQKHEMDLKKGRLAIISGYYAITPSFITRYNDSMPETIVYNGSCRSLFNNSMADAFINNGARTYYGYTDYVSLNYDQAIVQSLFNSLINQNMTTDEAFNAVVAEHGANDGLASFAMKGSSIGVKTEGVINGTFEDETWNGWNGKGDVRVISQLGPLKPTAGNYMAIISTGLGFENNDFNGYDLNSNSYIEQNFLVPVGTKTLSFDYNFISEEPKEFVGSIYNDTFKATVTSSVYISSDSITSNVYGGDSVTSDVYGEQTILIATESINGSQSYWIDENKVAIDFYGGDDTTYMTNWKHVDFDVSQFAGMEPIVLRFHVWDQGDSIYDTAVLIDNIKLQ